MGGMCSSEANAPAEKPVVGLEARLVQAVIDEKRAKQLETAKKSNFNTLMLQFPRLRKGFQKVRELYVQLDVQKHGWLTVDDLRSRVGSIGLNPASSAMLEVYKAVAQQPQQRVQSSEFLLLMTVLYLLDGPTKSLIPYPEINQALAAVDGAFMFFDSSSDGCLERKEIVEGMQVGTGSMARSKSAADRLFDELDEDNSGVVTFNEFLSGIEKMVLEEDADDEDELSKDRSWIHGDGFSKGAS